MTRSVSLSVSRPPSMLPSIRSSFSICRHASRRLFSSSITFADASGYHSIQTPALHQIVSQTHRSPSIYVTKDYYPIPDEARHHLGHDRSCGTRKSAPAAALYTKQTARAVHFQTVRIITAQREDAAEQHAALPFSSSKNSNVVDFFPAETNDLVLLHGDRNTSLSTWRQCNVRDTQLAVWLLDHSFVHCFSVLNEKSFSFGIIVILIIKLRYSDPDR